MHCAHPIPTWPHVHHVGWTAPMTPALILFVPGEVRCLPRFSLLDFYLPRDKALITCARVLPGKNMRAASPALHYFALTRTSRREQSSLGPRV